MGQQQFGYRVMHTDGELVGLDVLYDYITAIDDTPLTQELTLEYCITKKLDNYNIGKLVSDETQTLDVNLTVFSIKTEQYRNVRVKIDDSACTEYLLSSILSYSSLTEAPAEHFLQVWDVLDESPAARAGLKPYVHYILNININECLYFDTYDFDTFLQEHEQCVCAFYVYDSDSENTELVKLVPNEVWFTEVNNRRKICNKNYFKSIGCSVRSVQLPGIVKINTKNLRK